MTPETAEQTRNPKGGRPKKSAGEIRSTAVLLRLTISEKAAISANAERAGLDVSDYLRSLGTGTAAPARPASNDDALPAGNAALISEVNRIGVNVNQLTRAVHRGADFTQYWREVGRELEGVLQRLAGRS